MKKICIFLFCFPLLTLFLPILLGLCFHNNAAPTVPRTVRNLSADDIHITYLDAKSNTKKEVRLEEYVIGVLAAEMPASYEIEALKAQAVAARSYILSKLDAESPDHPEAVVCTKPEHCKGWLSEADAKAKWKKSEQNMYWKKLCSAANATKGEYMICDDAVVEAFFFSSAGGRTENSEDVWVSRLPYLRSVESPEPANENTSRVQFTKKEFIRKLNPHLSAPLTYDTKLTFTDLKHTEGGSVASANLCGTTFKGTQIRSIFGLKSANFAITTDNDTVIFHVAGNGHGVGMSQKGANQMAKDGKKYTEILSHYYTNIQIVKN